MTWGFAELVYILCTLSSAACAGLLLRSYLRSPAALLLWSSVAFAMLAIENALLFCDMVVIPNHDLRAIRAFAGLSGVLLLLYALIVESEKQK